VKVYCFCCCKITAIQESVTTKKEKKSAPFFLLF